MQSFTAPQIRCLQPGVREERIGAGESRISHSRDVIDERPAGLQLKLFLVSSRRAHSITALRCVGNPNIKPESRLMQELFGKNYLAIVKFATIGQNRNSCQQ
jgi:hypothetical protein